MFLFHFFLHLNKLFCDSKTFIKYEFTVIFENLDGDRNFTNCIQDRHYLRRKGKNVGKVKKKLFNIKIQKGKIKKKIVFFLDLFLCHFVFLHQTNYFSNLFYFLFFFSFNNVGPVWNYYYPIFFFFLQCEIGVSKLLIVHKTLIPNKYSVFKTCRYHSDICLNNLIAFDPKVGQRININ